MTVGQPEINLNSWGIRYVKVKQSPTAELDKDPKEPTFTEPKTGEVKETKRETTSNTGRTTPNSRQQPSDIASRTTSHLSDLDVETGIPADRQSDSAGDKDVKVLGSDQTTGQGGAATAGQVHTTVDSKGKPHYSSGSRKRETIGANTSDDPTVGSTQGGKGSKTLTSGQHGTQSGKKGVPKWYAPSESTSTGNVGSNVGHSSGIKDPAAADYHETYDPDNKPLPDKTETGITNRPTNFKKPKEGEGGTAESGKKFDEAHAKRMRKAIMDMNIAILKCKNFKMKRIAYSSGGDFGRRYPSRYGDENTHDAGIDDLRYSQRNSQAVQSKTETLAPDRKDETEVSSYGEGATGQHGKEGDKKLNVEGKVVDTNNEKPRTSVKSDEIVAKAIELINEAYDQIGKGKNVEETQDKYRDEFDSIDQDNPQEVDEEEFNSLGYQKELKERENSQKGDSEEDNLEDLNNNMKVTGQALDTLGSALDSRKKDSAVTTGTEGTNNPVMAGKKNSKSRKHYNDWYKEEVTNQT
mgnify:CR=1 FL=1